MYGAKQRFCYVKKWATMSDQDALPKLGVNNKGPRGELPFYGRRKGRPLRPQMQKYYDELLPQISVPRDLETLEGLFPHNPKDIYLEIGFGGGEHLAAIAGAAPECGFIGAEPFMNGVASLLRHIDEDGISNIRIWPDDVRLILDFLPEACLAGAYIMFPDPWPKKRHAGRRILQASMRDRLARLIRPGGSLRMASDHPIAKTWLLAEAMADDRFEWCASSAKDWQNRPEGWPETRYMAKGVDEGRASSWFDFKRL